MLCDKITVPGSIWDIKALTQVVPQLVDGSSTSLLATPDSAGKPLSPQFSPTNKSWRACCPAGLLGVTSWGQGTVLVNILIVDIHSAFFLISIIMINVKMV